MVNSLTQTDRLDYFGNSLYHSFQARLERRFASGISLLAVYTWAHSIGDTAGFSRSGNVLGDSGLQNPLNRNLERGNDDQDVRHRFVAGLSVRTAVWIRAQDRRGLERVSECGAGRLVDRRHHHRTYRTAPECDGAGR